MGLLPAVSDISAPPPSVAAIRIPQQLVQQVSQHHHRGRERSWHAFSFDNLGAKKISHKKHKRHKGRSWFFLLCFLCLLWLIFFPLESYLDFKIRSASRASRKSGFNFNAISIWRCASTKRFIFARATP